MRKYLLKEGGNFYKANLHSHSNLSDGKLSPAEMKEIYKKEGYSILACTDHDVFIPHNDLTDEDFLMLNGYEVEIKEENKPDFSVTKTCHICFLALEPDNTKQVCYHRSKYYFANAVKTKDMVEYDEAQPDYERKYTPECISDMMKIGRDNGFFVTYNHPAWSLEAYNDYTNYHHMHAMEICNFGCFVEGHTDYNEKEYDDMLRSGKRIFCIAADDNHNYAPFKSRRYDSFGAFTVIKADKLEYREVTKALRSGSFYASQGPEIYDLFVEDGKIHINCSPADKIVLNTGRRRAVCEYSENGNLVTSASFEIFPQDVYVRITVTDEKGRHANTNAYFIDTL